MGIRHVDLDKFCMEPRSTTLCCTNFLNLQGASTFTSYAVNINESAVAAKSFYCRTYTFVVNIVHQRFIKSPKLQMLSQLWFLREVVFMADN